MVFRKLYILKAMIYRKLYDSWTIDAHFLLYEMSNLGLFLLGRKKRTQYMCLSGAKKCNLSV